MEKKAHLKIAPPKYKLTLNNTGCLVWRSATFASMLFEVNYSFFTLDIKSAFAGALGYTTNHLGKSQPCAELNDLKMISMRSEVVEITCWCTEFVRYRTFRQVYWRGNHFNKMDSFLAELRKKPQVPS